MMAPFDSHHHPSPIHKLSLQLKIFQFPIIHPHPPLFSYMMALLLLPSSFPYPQALPTTKTFQFHNNHLPRQGLQGLKGWTTSPAEPLNHSNYPLTFRIHDGPLPLTPSSFLYPDAFSPTKKHSTFLLNR